MKRIKDPVHGYVPIRDDFVKHIVDRKFFQRLRQVRQLTATHLVYPSGNHTRFEHSIGVYHLAEKALESLESNGTFDEVSADDVDEIKDTVSVAALLHDVGHPPLSHIGEQLLDRDKIVDRLERHDFASEIRDIAAFGQDPLERHGRHELLSCVIILEEFGEGLRAMDIPPNEVCAYVLGVSIIGERDDVGQRKVAADLISSGFDVDRLDYIARDDLMTGAEVANVDTDRVVRSYSTAGGGRWCSPIRP